MSEHEELIELKNGQYIMNELISKRMFDIKSRKPEARHWDNTGYSWDECGLAELFSECYEDTIRYCPEAVSWYCYDNGRWSRDIGNVLISEKIKEFSRLMALYCIEIEDEEQQANYSKFIQKLGDRRFRGRVMDDAKSVSPIRQSQFDNHPLLINCHNGTLDLHTLEFREHRWEDYLTMQTRFDYSHEPQIDNRWNNFIKEVCSHDHEKARYLQTAMGYSILGSSKEECMFILHGKTTRNGKSTLLSAIHYMLGDYASVAPVSIICKNNRSKNADAPSPIMASMQGKRVVTMAESNQYGAMDEEMIKQLTGGEEISARQLYQLAFTYLPQFTLWLSCNDLPTVTDKSLFSSNRLRIIEFNRHFKQFEQNKDLKSLFQTPQLMMSIFNWLLAGYRIYEKEGLVMPEHMERVISAYEDENDDVLTFLKQMAVRDPDSSTKCKVLYDHYKVWAKSNGYVVVSAKKFNADLTTHPEWYDAMSKLDGFAICCGIRMKG